MGWCGARDVWAAHKDWQDELEARDVWTTALTESHEFGISHDGGQKRDHLRNNAATSSVCINGNGGDRFGLGGVGGDGEEVSEGIHWCDCVVCGLTDAMELF